MDIINYIKHKMEARGVTKFDTQPVEISVTNPYMLIDLNKYVYLLVSESVDTPVLPTRVLLSSPDNAYQFTKTTLENSVMSKYQFFSEELTIKTDNYGSDSVSDFVPFTLEFMKIIPLEYAKN